MKGLKTSVTFLTLCVTIIAGGCIGIGYWGTAHEKFERTEELAYEAAQFAEFHTETTNGSIIAQGMDTDRVSIHAVITGRAKTQDQAQQLAQETILEWKEIDNTLHLVIQKPQHPKYCSISVSLEISLPRQTGLNLKSTNGRIAVSDIDNNVIAKTTNGRVELTNIAGHLQAASTNGRIEADQVTGNANCHTTNGKITCNGLHGNLTAATTNGSVEAGYDPSAPADQTIDICTTNGSINVNLSAEFAGTAKASTSNGKIHCDRPVTVSGRIDKHLNGTIGNGNGRLNLKTTNGSIHIR